MPSLRANENRCASYVQSREMPVKGKDGEWGDHLEIVVCEEMLDRLIEIYGASVAGRRRGRAGRRGGVSEEGGRERERERQRQRERERERGVVFVGFAS